MKTVTKKDFQNLYKSPGTKETEEMRQTLAHLSEKKSPERVPVIRRRRVAFILAVVMALMMVAAILAFRRDEEMWRRRKREKAHGN